MICYSKLCQYRMLLYDKSKMLSCGIFTFLVILYTLENVQSDYILSINANSNSKKFTHFWKSTGFCPPEPRNKICEYLLSNDVKMNLVLIGSLPNKSIKQVRIHWLLDLISITSFDKDETPIFDYKCADLFFDWLHSQNVRPGFELMGNPSSYFNNLLDEKQKRHWEILVRDIVLRYIEKYGAKYVSKWKFETWNEPDLKGYNSLNFTLPSYMSYISASRSALQFASLHTNTTFRLGGPAGLFKSPERHPLCWGLLESCGEQGQSVCPLNFISFHKKGEGTAHGVVDKGWKLVEQMQKRYPKLKGMKIANDEADILTGWSKSAEWRADVRYAAMVVKVVIDHYIKFVKENNINIEVLSNDNAFLNYHPYYFTQRTLLTRFQMNNTNPPHIQFIKKPVYTTMALLSYLGKRALDLSTVANFSYLATTSLQNKVYEFSVILSYVNDTKQESNRTTAIDVSVRDLPKNKYMYVVYLLNNNGSNPYKVWKEFGAPVFPNGTVREKMRQAEGPIRMFPPTDLPAEENLSIRIPVLLPTVALLHICSDGGSPPGQVTDLQVFNVTKNEVLVVWKDRKINTKCVRTFEIGFLRETDDSGNEIGDQLFKRVNYDDVIFLWFHFVGKEGTDGTYRVRAVDYWGRCGPYSNPVTFKMQP